MTNPPTLDITDDLRRRALNAACRERDQAHNELLRITSRLTAYLDATEQAANHYIEDESADWPNVFDIITDLRTILSDNETD